MTNWGGGFVPVQHGVAKQERPGDEEAGPLGTAARGVGVEARRFGD